MSLREKAHANPWIAHVKKVQKEKGLSYKDALKEAKKTYVSQTKRRESKKKRGLEPLKGSGLRDDAIKLLQSRPNAIKRMLKKYGGSRITAIDVCRTPVESVIQKALNLLSRGAFKQEVQRLAYDDMFHLFMVMHFDNGKKIRIEKNEVVVVSEKIKLKSNSECKSTALINRIILQDLIQEAENIHSNLYRYTPWKYNCQDFIFTLLKIMNVDKPLKDFVMQDFTEAFNQNPKLKKLSISLTDVAALGKRILFGAGVVY